jgi:hypothetical protein
MPGPGKYKDAQIVRLYVRFTLYLLVPELVEGYLLLFPLSWQTCDPVR